MDTDIPVQSLLHDYSIAGLMELPKTPLKPKKSPPMTARFILSRAAKKVYTQ